MATLGPNSKITTKQYLEKRDERLKQDELEDNSVYAWYVRLTKGSLEAIRLAASAELAAKVGANVVELSVLDEDLQPVVSMLGRMEDGLWHTADQKPLGITYNGSDMQAEESYLLDYNDGLGMPTVEAAQSMKIPADSVGA